MTKLFRYYFLVTFAFIVSIPCHALAARYLNSEICTAAEIMEKNAGIIIILILGSYAIISYVIIINPKINEIFYKVAIPTLVLAIFPFEIMDIVIGKNGISKKECDEISEESYGDEILKMLGEDNLDKNQRNSR